MKKIFTILLIFSGMLKIAHAQTPDWLWLQGSGGGTGYQYGGGVGTDDSGYVYIGGRLNGTIIFGTKSEKAGGTNHLYGKFDKNGNCLWLSQSAIGFDYPRGFCTDRAKKNNEYEAGNVNSGDEMFVEKVNNEGVLQWSKTLGSGYNYGTAPNADGVAADSAGNVYVTGETGGGSGSNWTFGDSILNYSGTGIDQEMFLTKLDKNGNFLWAVGADGVDASSGGYDVGRGIVLSKTGQYVFISGGYTGTPSFHSRFSSGDQTAPAAASGKSNLFVAKYDTAGNLIFVVTATNSGIPWISAFNSGVGPINAVAVDSCDDIFVTGYYQGTAQFGPFTLTATNTNGQSDGFVGSCNSKGQWQWVNDIGSNSSSVSDYGQTIVLDKNNDVYVGGTIYGTANFGNGISVTASSAGGSLFLAKYANSNGVTQWAQGPSGTSGSGVGGLAVDDQKFVYICGTFNGTMTLGSTTKSASTSNGNIYIAKLDTVPARYIVPLVDSDYCPGSTVLLPYSLTGTFNTGNVFTAQLSDSTGSFVNAINIGDTTTASAGAISITIPGNTKAGSTYLIRVISSSPATSSYVNGCGAYYQKNVYVNNFYVTIGGGSATANISPDTSICFGSFAQLHVSGANTYLWSPGSTLDDSTSANPEAAPSSTQIYTVTATGGCGTVTKIVMVTVNSRANIVVTPDSATVCSGSTASLEASGGLTYSWSPATGLSCATCANPGASPTISTTYSVTGNGGACSNTVLVPVIVGNTAKSGVASAARDTICYGTPGSLLLTGSSGNGIQWQSSPDDVTFTNALNDTLSTYKTAPLSQTTFYRAVVGKGNCMAISNTDTLYVPPSLTASFYATQASANQLTFNSDSSLGNIRSYHWDFGDGQTSNLQNPQHTYAKDSTYYVCLTLYDGSNCSYTFCRYSSVTDGIPVVSAAGNWIIYPNPFSEQLTVSSKQLGMGDKIQSMVMYDVLGRVVVNAEIGNSTNTSLQLDVSSLAKGMYYVMIKTANADYVQKVVKQ